MPVARKFPFFREISDNKDAVRDHRYIPYMAFVEHSSLSVRKNTCANSEGQPGIEKTSFPAGGVELSEKQASYRREKLPEKKPAFTDSGQESRRKQAVMFSQSENRQHIRSSARM